MKKWDYIIAIICLSVVSIFCVFFVLSRTNDEFNAVEIRYHNEVIANVDVNFEATYKIECIDNKISLYREDVLIKQLDVDDKDFFNTFKITNKRVEMIDASCNGKDCEKMYITSKHMLPIICTNGVSINPVGKTEIDDLV